PPEDDRGVAVDARRERRPERGGEPLRERSGVAGVVHGDRNAAPRRWGRPEDEGCRDEGRGDRERDDDRRPGRAVPRGSRAGREDGDAADDRERGHAWLPPVSCCSAGRATTWKSSPATNDRISN